eukprot:jgi/Chlat1/8330/Chrsp8S08105
MGALLGAAAFVGALAFQPWPVVRWLSRRLPSIYFCAPPDCTQRVVALTIDDSPHPAVTPELLEALKEHGCKATFFVIGDNVKRWPHIAHRIAEEGHELGNHTMQDVPSWRLPEDEFDGQLMELDAMLQPYWERQQQQAGLASSQNRRKWFRPGHGWVTPRLLHLVSSRQYSLALGSIYPHDPLTLRLPNAPQLIARFVVGKVRPGSVVVLHDGKEERRGTAEVLHRVLPQLKARGYDVVTLSELYARTHVLAPATAPMQ